MSNICMDTVVFYAKSQKEKVGLATLKLAFEKAYPSESAVDNKFSRFFVENNLPTQGLNQICLTINLKVFIKSIV